MPSGFTSVQQDDGVVEDPQRLGIGLRIQAVDRLDQLLRAEHFGGVQAAVDPHHRLAVPARAAAPVRPVSFSASASLRLASLMSGSLR